MKISLYLLVFILHLVPINVFAQETEPQKVTVRDLNSYSFELSDQSELPNHPLVGELVTFDAFIVSYPKNSGLASITSSGTPGRIHLFVMDIEAADFGPDGMSTQLVVDGANRDLVEQLFVGDVIRVEGRLTFFGNVGQFSGTSVEHLGNISINDEYQSLISLAQPTEVSLNDINIASDVDGKYKWNSDNYTKFINRYVTLKNLEVIGRIDAPTGRPWMVLSDGKSIIYTNDISLRFRNDRGFGYAYNAVSEQGLNYNWRRLAEGLDGPYSPPPIGSIVDISGFITVNTFNPAQLDEGTNQSTFKISPWDDGILWTQDGEDTTFRITDNVNDDLVIVADPNDFVKVKFVVNTSSIPDTVSVGDQVQIRGAVKRAGESEFQEVEGYFGQTINWNSRSVTLQNIGGDYWSKEMKFAPGDELLYKIYTAKKAENGDWIGHDGGGWESNSELSDGNYRILIPDNAIGSIDVPVVYFNRTAPFEPATDGQNALFFRVNVGYQQETGLIDESTLIGVRGTPAVFQNPEDWSSTTAYLSREESPSDSKNVFYSGVVYVDESLTSTQFEYKFVIETDGGLTVWEDGANKINSVGLNDTTYYFRFFNNQRPPTEDIVEATIEFAVNTSNLELLGLFDPLIDEVSIPSNFNGWDTNTTIMDYNSQEGIWSKLVSFTEIPGANINFKYFLRWDESRYDESSPNYISNLPQNHAILYGWEESGLTGGNYRTHRYSSESNQVANSRTTYFNSIPPEGIILKTVSEQESISVTFTVDMTDALSYSTPFNPGTDKLYLIFETPVFALTQNLNLNYRFQLLNEAYNDQLDRVELIAVDGQPNVYSLTFDLALPTDNEFGIAIAYVKPGDVIVSNSAETNAGRRYYRYIQPSFRTLDGNFIWPDSYEIAPIAWKAPTTLDIETPPDYDQLLSTLPVFEPPVPSAEFDLAVTISDNSSNVSIVNFGVKETASVGFDADFDQYAPPLPPAGVFDVRFNRNSEGYYKDYQPYSDGDIIWRLSIQPTGNSYPIDLSWDSEALPESGELILRDAFTGTLFSFDMMSGSSVTLGTELSNINQFEIVYRQSSTIEIQQSYRSGWDLVGLPVSVENTAANSLFNNSLNNSLFGFNGQYQNSSNLETGKGYWLRFGNSSNAIFSGDPIETLNLSLSAGWNLISGPSESVPLMGISDLNSIIVSGTLFGFNGAYSLASTIEPGRGYWLRTNQAGTITLQGGTASKTTQSHPSMALSGFDRIDFLSGSEDQPVSTLYLNGSIPSPYSSINFELPPIPPSGNVDIRWEQGSYVSASSRAVALIQQGKTQLMIKVPELSAGETQSGSNPALVSIREFTGDQLINEAQIQRGDLYTLSGQTNHIEFELQEKVDLPNEFTLDQNYPNPFNPTTTIRFGLPESADVSLEVYTVLGQKVMTLVNENRSAGWHTVSFNGSRLSSGVYVYRIQAGGMIQTRKLMLVK